jgi:hypothetical protein
MPGESASSQHTYNTSHAVANLPSWYDPTDVLVGGIQVQRMAVGTRCKDRIETEYRDCIETV